MMLWHGDRPDALPRLPPDHPHDRGPVSELRPAKPDGVVPTWIEPEARTLKPALTDVLGAIGPYAGGALLVGALLLAIAAFAIVETLMAIAVIVVVVLAALAVAAWLAGAGI